LRTVADFSGRVLLEVALHKQSSFSDDFSRKGAKAQSATAFLRVFFAPLRLCAFVPLREKYFLPQALQGAGLILFVQSPFNLKTRSVAADREKA
jgi:hypothetical protein